jgi:hypothetical protein
MAYDNRGVAWRQKDDKRKALADFKAALAIDPSLVVSKEHARQLKQAKAAATLHALSDPLAVDPLH